MYLCLLDMNILFAEGNALREVVGDEPGLQSSSLIGGPWLDGKVPEVIIDLGANNLKEVVILEDRSEKSIHVHTDPGVYHFLAFWQLRRWRCLVIHKVFLLMVFADLNLRHGILDFGFQFWICDFSWDCG